MEVPYTVASLPSPLDKEHGRIYVAPVHALKGSRKRKRHEVAATVDGEGISIFHVQTQALVASYAVPPQTYFCRRPCSIFCRATSDNPAQRLTYVAVKDGPRSKGRRLVCFTENVRSKKDVDEGYSAPKKIECAIPDGEICSLDTVASSSGEIGYLVVAYHDGRVASVKSDLSAMHEDRPAFAAKGAEEIEYSAVIDMESAKKGILKSREDVLAALDVTGTGSVRGGLICQVARSNGHRRFELLLLQGHGQDGLQTRKAGAQSIVNLELPISGRASPVQAQHEIHAPSGKLTSLLGGKLVVYDFRGILPKVSVELGSTTEPILSFTRLSTSMLVATSTTTATVYETTYGASQATCSLQTSATVGTSLKKRKRNSNDFEDTQTTSAVVSAFSELRVLVYRSGTQLAAIQLGEEVLIHTRGKERSPRLTDVLGQGTSNGILRFGQDDKRDNGKEPDWAVRIDNLIEDNDVEGLESLVANDEALGRQRKPEKSRRKKPEDEEDVNGDATAYDDLWPLPEPLDSTKLDRQRILYIVSKVFSYAPDEPQIEVRIASRKLLEWLALAGYLNRHALEKALRPDGVTQREPIHPGDIMTAISETDEEFQLMHELLSLPAQWELSEVIQAMCLLIRSFDAVPESTEQMEPDFALLGARETNGDDGVLNGDVAMVNSDANSHVESESKAAETELEHVERVLMSGLEVRSGTLRVILERLHAFPALDVTRTMRAMMTQKELIFLIHMLRIELADGGWTSRYAGAGADEERYEGSSDSLLVSMVDVIPGDGETGPSNQAIRAISYLLNCAVDAVGTSGWLVGLSGDALGTKELLDSLRAEVSAGLEGCYEANTLGTFLAELEHFVASKCKQRNRGAEEAVVDAALPVGRAEAAALKSKNAAGKKSKQLIALEKSKRVGKYSLDRIRF